MTIGLSHIAHALPRRIVSSGEIAAAHGFEEAFISDKLGIASRHIAAEDETVSSLAIEAGRKVLAKAGIEPEQIDILILVTQTPDYTLPHTSALVQDGLGLPKTTAAFDISLGCSGFVYGLSVAQSMLAQQEQKTALLITSETYSKLMDPDDRSTAPLFGDGAAATIVTANAPLYRPGKFTFGTDGGRHEALIARGTGYRSGEREPLFMNGRGIFTFMMSEIPADIDLCLERNGLEKGDIDTWVFHQASQYMIEMLSKRLGIPRESAVIDLADTGNTTSSTIPIALERCVLNRHEPPKHVFISGFGVGLSWASTVLSRCDDPT